MLIVIANNLPPAVRGRLKLWFIEPKPNVFVSGVKHSVAETVLKYLYKHTLHIQFNIYICKQELFCCGLHETNINLTLVVTQMPRICSPFTNIGS